jgi:ABC-type polysaccharide/polyol phosphate export permease
VLRTFVEWNPVSTVTQACRELFGNTDPSIAVPDTWPMQHPEIYTLLWVVLIIAVFAPLSVRQYKRATKK